MDGGGVGVGVGVLVDNRDVLEVEQVVDDDAEVEADCRRRRKVAVSIWRELDLNMQSVFRNNLEMMFVVLSRNSRGCRQGPQVDTGRELGRLCRDNDVTLCLCYPWPVQWRIGWNDNGHVKVCFVCSICFVLIRMVFEGYFLGARKGNAVVLVGFV